MLRAERHARIIDVASRVPRGRVATYGQIAALAGLPRHARHVGFALRELPDDSDVIEKKFESLIRTPFLDVTPYPSPDGKWLAVASAETGRLEVYVHRLESPGGRWQLSTDGGVHPIWSRDGGTIYYVTEQGGRLMAVEVEIGETFRAGTPAELMRVATPRMQEKPYDVTVDGSKFIWNAVTGDRAESPEITVVLNWDRMLERE